MNDEPQKEPIFLDKGNGLGWTLNFNRRESYWILALILAVPFGIAIYAVWFS